MSRPRAQRKKDLPENLYEYKGYYAWKDPRPNGKKYGLGRDKKSAIRQALEANLQIIDELSKARLVDRLRDGGYKERTMDLLIQNYEAKIKQEKQAEVTLNEKLRYLQAIAKSFTGKIVDRVETIDIVEFLSGFADKTSTAQKYRTRLKELFRFGMAQGWCKTNPVEVTDIPKAKVLRERLTFETFNLIYEKALTLPAWIPNSIALGLVTGQRRGDIINMKFDHIKDGFLWVQQSKSKHNQSPMRLKIPLALELKVLKLTVADAVENCKKTGVKSEFMIHRLTGFKGKIAGETFAKTQLSNGFQKARELTNLEWDGEPPSFHELRSLAERLYKAQGIDTTTLLGHKHARTTGIYHDSRGADWIEVKL